MWRMRPDKETLSESVMINGRKALIVRSRNFQTNGPGILWVHGGGYETGMMQMVYFSRAMDLVKKYGAVVLTVDYRLAPKYPYPCGFEDCYAGLLYLKENAERLNIRSDQIMVGGESAGGGMTVALCMKARDEGSVNIAFQMPLYPMLDHRDTESSKDNHGKVWDTKKNHRAWDRYLKNTDIYNVPIYASPALCKDYSNLPPCYTFVCDGEPFYSETLTYIDNLKQAGIEAECDVYHGNVHAFDLEKPNAPMSKEAARKFEEHYLYALLHYFAPQKEES